MSLSVEAKTQKESSLWCLKAMVCARAWRGLLHTSGPESTFGVAAESIFLSPAVQMQDSILSVSILSLGEGGFRFQ